MILLTSHIPSEDSDRSVHSRAVIGVFAGLSAGSQWFNAASGGQWRFWSAKGMWRRRLIWVFAERAYNLLGNNEARLNSITKTCLYNFDPLKPQFYTVKLGFRGVYIIFPHSAQNIDYGYSLEPPRRGGSTEYPQSMFWAEIWKILEFFICKCSFFGGKIFSIFEWACFRNDIC